MKDKFEIDPRPIITFREYWRLPDDEERIKIIKDIDNFGNQYPEFLERTYQIYQDKLQNKMFRVDTHNSERKLVATCHFNRDGFIYTKFGAVIIMNELR